MAAMKTGFRNVQQLALVCLSVVAATLALGCNEGGIGDPCIPEDEYQTEFAGYSENEVNVESRSFQCETRVCLVNKFRGRVSCKYGQGSSDAEANPKCQTPDKQEPIRVAVEAQLEARRPINSVYCSCRCAGVNGVTDDGAPYCECPSGFRCEDLIKDFGLGNKQLAGGYCVKEGTEVASDAISKKACAGDSCGAADDHYN